MQTVDFFASTDPFLYHNPSVTMHNDRWIATSPISKGDLIMVMSPLAIFFWETDPKLANYKMEQLLHTFHERLIAARRQADSEAHEFERLVSKLRTSPSTDTTRGPFGIDDLRANLFSDLRYGTFSILPILGVIRHSCFPNAFIIGDYQDNFSDTQFAMYATLDITENESVTLNRIGILCDQKAPRDKELKRIIGDFSCECEVCKPGCKVFPSDFACDFSYKQTIYIMTCVWCGVKAKDWGWAAKANIDISDTNFRYCDNCTNVVYCSNVCKEEHFKIIHGTRCLGKLFVSCLKLKKSKGTQQNLKNHT